jgi:hypothetical protein
VNKIIKESIQKKYFINSCEYKLTGINSWQIDVQSVNCDQWSTCKKILSITLGGFNVIATGKNVTVNGVKLNSNQGYVNGRK